MRRKQPCTKARYPTWCQASRSARSQERNRSRLAHAYWCARCRAYHLGRGAEDIIRLIDAVRRADSLR